MYRVVAFVASVIGRVLVVPFYFIKDRKSAERIGMDRPELFERILMWLLPHKDIIKVIEGVPTLYLRRFYLTPKSWPARIFLHHIVSSDTDRAVHDHPFDFSTCILRGAYVEQLCNDPEADDYRLATPGTVLDNPAEHSHSVTIFGPVWSLVVASRPRREWGFWATNTCWVDWRTYLGVTK